MNRTVPSLHGGSLEITLTEREGGMDEHKDIKIPNYSYMRWFRAEGNKDKDSRIQ